MNSCFCLDLCNSPKRLTLIGGPQTLLPLSTRKDFGVGWIRVITTLLQPTSSFGPAICVFSAFDFGRTWSDRSPVFAVHTYQVFAHSLHIGSLHDPYAPPSSPPSFLPEFDFCVFFSFLCVFPREKHTGGKRTGSLLFSVSCFNATFFFRPDDIVSLAR